MTDQPTTRTALHDVLNLLTTLHIDPQEVHVKGHHHDPDPIVTITFRTLADLAAWAKADGSKTLGPATKRIGTTGEHQEHHAMYDKPGRQMLAVARIYRHMTDTTEEN